ncbi:endonuclease/exonuclease/phosphatase family protein [Bacteroidota bacterium]
MILLYLFFPILMSGVVTENQISIKAMTFNIRYGTANDGENSWEYRKDLVFDVFKDYECDFVGTQEALIFQIEEIVEQVPSYAWIGRSRTDDPRKGEACPLFYRKDKWDLLGSGTLWLSKTPEKVASKSWNSSLPRIFTWGKFKNQGNGVIVTVYNTHYDHRSVEARKHSSGVILEHMKKNTKGERIILTGDLNAMEDQPPVQNLVSDPKLMLIDSYRQTNPSETDKDGTFHGWKADAPVRRIDYIFNSNDLSVKSSEVVDYNVNGRYPSDHKPVFAEFIY